jgi:hypothetical protein
MVYTAYEMIRDCRENRPEGWRYFIAHYVPVLRKLLAHYGAADAVAVERIAADRNLFSTMEPAAERPFVAELRQRALAGVPAPWHLGIEEVAAALEPLTMLEKQATWIETMRYTAAETGAMLRMSPATVGKIRDRAAELLRGHLSSWSRTMLADGGVALGREAAAARTKECPSGKVFLDVVDGRATWQGREEVERHVASCWHCIDHFCRMAEVIELLRGVQPLSAEESAPFLRRLGTEEKRTGWRGILGPSAP